MIGTSETDEAEIGLMVSKGFKRLKERSGADTKRIGDATWLHSRSDKFAKKHTKNRAAVTIGQALAGTKSGVAIANCYRKTRKQGHRVCGSVFCEDCRERKQQALEQTYWKYVNETFDGDEAKARNKLRFVSVLHSLEAIDFDHKKASFDRVASAVEGMKKQIANVGRTAKRRDADLWMAGAVHLEMIDMNRYAFIDFSDKKTGKEKTLKGMMEDMGVGYADRVVLVHYHAVIDRDELSDAELKELFGSYWDQASNVVRISRLTDVIEGRKHKFADAVRNIARYCYNGSNTRGDMELMFKRNWGGSGKVYETGEQIDEKGNTITYAKEVMDAYVDGSGYLSVADVRVLVELHDHIGGDSGRGLRIGIR